MFKFIKKCIENQIDDLKDFIDVMKWARNRRDKDMPFTENDKIYFSLYHCYIYEIKMFIGMFLVPIIVFFLGLYIFN